jgi:hypothetical protein
MDEEIEWKSQARELAWEVSSKSKLRNMAICACHWLIVSVPAKTGVRVAGCDREAASYWPVRTL